jgi:hypothetical protein
MRDSAFLSGAGPLVNMNPVPVLSAKVSGFNSGNISVVLNHGEVCKGQWGVASKGITAVGPNGMPLDTGDMSSLWDSIYGQDFYKSHILGTTMFQSVAYGKKGTTVGIQLYKSSVGEIKGIAKDSHGNVYKVLVN